MKWSAELRWYRLSFPRGLELDAVLAVLSSLSGMSYGTRLVLELSADDGGITHRVGLPGSAAEVVAAELRAASGGIRLDDDVPPSRTATRRVFWQIMPRAGAIRSDDPATTAASLLSSFFPLRSGEWLCLRWTLRSTGKPVLDVVSEGTRDGRLRVLRAKLELAGLRSVGELSVGAPSRARANHLLNRSSSVLRGLATPHGRLVADAPIVGTLSYVTGFRGRYFSVRELAAVIGWPIGELEHLPGIELGGGCPVARRTS
jgi:hypothetical protein